MYEIVWQYDETAPHKDEKPDDAPGARRRLLDGNLEFASFFAPHRAAGETTRQVVKVSPQDVGISGRPGDIPVQRPFAAFLSCADARVPVELIFGQKANDLFVVRVAGNVIGDESLGSLDYAVDQLGTVRLLAVLGHTGCGAVTAAVDAYLTPAGYLGIATSFPLQTIVSSLMAPVRGAAFALSGEYGQEVDSRPGYRLALIETTVMLNAALSAAVLIHNFHEALGDRLQVSFGVYDLRQRTVGLPGADGAWQEGLFAPPTTQETFNEFGRTIARSDLVRAALGE
jgi:carbonic anhydrase